MSIFFRISVAGFLLVGTSFLYANLENGIARKSLKKKQETLIASSEKKNSKNTSTKSMLFLNNSNQLSKKDPIFFKGENMVALRSEGSVELQKNVVVSQGEVTITADYSKLFFSEKEQVVEKIYAKGHVSFHQENKEELLKTSGYGDEAVYTLRDQVLVLKENVKLIRGNDTVDANYLRYDLANGRVHAEGAVGVIKP